MEELLKPKDLFLALNQAVPFFTKSKIIGFSHGLSYMYFPELYPDQYERLRMQFITMMRKSSHIIVSSQKVKDEMMEKFPHVKNIHVIPFGMPFDMEKPKNEDRKTKMFLFVGMDHPIKQVNFLINAFLRFQKKDAYSDYTLNLIGPFSHMQNRKKNIICESSVTRLQLRSLYQTATAYLTSSKYESFNLPVLEALSQGCQVVGLSSAIIPELRNYVFTANGIDSFVGFMKQIADGRRKKIEYRRLNMEFSWKNYVKQLMKLYSV